ncbi:MAG: PKD domain-containing protein [Opitutales bacterium]|nr:PKD domain-containing protein [Opitutales bacterium]
MKRIPFSAGRLLSVCLFLFPALLAASVSGPIVHYAGGGANTRFHDVRELSDGTLLVLGITNNLDWIDASVPRTELVPNGLPNANSARTAFLLRISGDAGSILEVAHLPHGSVINLRWMRSTEIPGEPTGTLYVSGQIPGGYFIAPLNNNFVDGRPTGFAWTYAVSAANGHEIEQLWDVGNDGRVVFAEGGEWSATVGFLDPTGARTSLPALRASHWVNGSYVRGIGAEFPDAVHSAIRLPTDNQSWTDEELFAITPDGNGGIRQGTWPIDIMIRFSFDTGEPVRVINGTAYGYNGYRAEGRHWIGAISVDRRNNHFYFGYNIKSILAPGSGHGENPDFEPAVIGYDAEGNMKWWNRLYREAADTTGDGLIDTTWRSEPDQYIDGMDIDYSIPLSEGGNVVVVARCHGNNVSNFWAGNAIAARPGASGFQNRFTGTEGNIHISYIARLQADQGDLLAATYVAGFFRRIISGKGQWPTQPYPEPIHDGWPNHNAGWPDLTTTGVTKNSARVGPDGRVYMVGVGPRMVTTSNAHQKLPRRLGHNNPVLNEGTSPWSNWVRAYEPNLDALAYSSALMGTWTYPDGNIDAEPVGASNTVLQGVWPISGGLLVVGQHSNGAGTSASGNNIPTANVPAWGEESYNGITAVFGLMPFDEGRPVPAFAAVENGGRLFLDATDSTSASAITEYRWTFGDGSTATGPEPTHEYIATGTYLVGLTVTNEDGYSASTHQFVVVENLEYNPAGVIRFSSDAVSVDEDAGTVSVEVVRGGSERSVSVAYATGDGTAVAGEDYVAVSGTLEWADGDGSARQIVVTIIDDEFALGDVTFQITLSDVAGGALLGEPSTTTVTIIDNETNEPPAITLNLPRSDRVAVPSGVGLMLDTTVTDDGMTPGPVTTTWELVSGPQPVLWDAADAPVTGVRFSEDGSYTLRLTADDGYAQSTQEVQVLVGIEPGVFLSTDIGNTNPAGSASEEDGVFTLLGSGADIWGSNDAFHFAYSTLVGDGEIIAQVNYVANPGGDPWAKAGVMMRETLDANSRNVMVHRSASNGNRAQFRTATGASTSSSGSGNRPWVRLVRSGNTFTGFSSVDGVTWVQLGSNTVVMPEEIYIGLAVTSHRNNFLTTVDFSNVSGFGDLGNIGPAADAGADVVAAQVSTPVSLTGSADDDGLPADIGMVVTEWIHFAGPGLAAFGDVGALSTTVTFDTPGTHRLRLLADDGEVQTFGEIEVTVDGEGTPLTPAEQWRQTFFGSPANTGDGADDMDPDKDGIPNRLERAFGGNPYQPNSAFMPVVESTPVGGAAHLTVTYHRLPGGVANGASYTVADLVYVVEFSNDLIDWSPATLSHLTVTPNGEVDEVVARVNPALASDAPQFVRVSVNSVAE